MWLTSLDEASIPLLDKIEFVNAYRHVDKMIRIPPKVKQLEKQAKRKPATPSLPLPTKYLWQSSSEFPIQDRKGKGKVKSLSDEDKEFKELIDDMMSQI